MLTILIALVLIVSLSYIYRLKKDIALINKSLKTIKNTETNMRLTTITFDKDICALALNLNEILDNQQKLMVENEKAARSFKQGITNVSHDLRTPLTSAMGYLQLIKSNKTSEAKKIEYIEIAENRLKSLTDLMKELFDYTQIVEGKLEIKNERINVSDVLCDQLSGFFEEFNGGGFQVEVEIPDSDMEVYCDIQSLRRIFQNLIKNVLVHGKEKFYLKVDSNQRKIIFKNKVKELDALEVERLFERFYTTDASRNSKRTGLGLAITKELIEQVGGEIKVTIEGDFLSLCIYLLE